MKWLPVAGYEGLYEVSDEGQIRSLRTGKIMSAAARQGWKYRKITLTDAHGVEGTFYVHRLIASAHLGPCPPGQQVNHKDNIKFNNRLGNLEYVTPSANMFHAWYVAKVPTRKGEADPMAKLTATDVEIIRQMCQAGESMKSVAGRFDINSQTVSNIIHRRHWAHIL